jgi:outer membrane lipoprotein-sorting protein
MEFRLNRNRAPEQTEAAARACARMRLTARLVASSLFLLVVLPAAALGQDQSVEEVLQRLQKVYAKECCFKASFDQLTVNVAMDMKDRFRGTMYVRKPGSIALDVDNPEPQRVVVQGREYTVYFPAEGNTVRGEIPAELNVESFLVSLLT